MATQTTRAVRSIRYQKAGEFDSWTLTKVLYKRYEMPITYALAVSGWTLAFYLALHK